MDTSVGCIEGGVGVAVLPPAVVLLVFVAALVVVELADLEEPPQPARAREPRATADTTRVSVTPCR
jgi:hypothetical protein